MADRQGGRVTYSFPFFDPWTVVDKAPPRPKRPEWRKHVDALAERPCPWDELPERWV
jgi:hypothetical protein